MDKELLRRKRISENNAKYWLGKKRPGVGGRPKGGTRSVEEMEKFRATIAKKDKKKYYCRDCGGVLASYKALRCRKCHDKYKVGELHHSWRGGKGTRRHSVMGTKKYREWRTAVFERDSYCCTQCGVSGSRAYLQADHIVPWSESVELRLDISNGRTLCVPCHELTPSFPKQLRRIVK